VWFFTACTFFPFLCDLQHMVRVGQNHIPIYGVYTVCLAGNSPNIRSNTVLIYGSGQPYTWCIVELQCVMGPLKEGPVLSADCANTL
jgi:hypothetical protein